MTVTGLTGVGKDYLAVRALEGTDTPLVNWGTMLGLLLDLDRDVMMSRTDPSLVTRKQFEVCDELVAMQPVVVTAHTVRSSGTNIEYNQELEQRLNPSAYVYVSAPPEIIQQRVIARNSSAIRSSEVLSVSDIQDLQDLKRKKVFEIASEIGADFINLSNIPECTSQNVRILSEILGNLAVKAQ